MYFNFQIWASELKYRQYLYNKSYLLSADIFVKKKSRELIFKKSRNIMQHSDQNYIKPNSI